jgi:hypothetical protein
MHAYFNLEAPAVTTPRISYYLRANGKFIIRGTNGAPGATCFALGTTNLSPPPALDAVLHEYL